MGSKPLSLPCSCNHAVMQSWLLVLLKKIVESFPEKFLNAGAVTIKHYLLELLRHLGVKVTDEGFLPCPARSLHGLDLAWWRFADGSSWTAFVGLRASASEGLLLMS